MAWWVFQNIVITTVLAAAVMLVARAARIGPVARHALWLLVLIKFVTPPLVVWPWAAPDPFGIAALDARVVEPQAFATPVVDPGATSAGPEGGEAEPVPVRAHVASGLGDSMGALAAASLWPWALGLWALGSLCVLGIEGVRLVRLARRVRAAAPADPAIVRRVEVLSARLGIRPVPVVTVDAASPVVWGFGRPCLLWPEALSANATDACIDGVLVHELAHVKRGDHLVGWIELAAGVAWWWNPLFWFVRSALREQAELACDAWVISALPSGRRAYAESLLALSGAFVPTTASMAVVGVRATSRRVLERRLVMIMKGRTSLRLPWVGLCSLALVGAATLPAWATASNQLPPQPPAPPAPMVAQVPPPPQAPPAPPSPPAQARGQVAPKVPPPPPPPPAPQTYKFATMKTPFKLLNGAAVWNANLPADGQQLLEGFETDRKAIQEEADKKIEDRRAAVVKGLEDLQAQYAKEGKLDEAVAIRDFLRAGGPGLRGFSYKSWR